MTDPKYVAIIRVPVYAETEDQARANMAPYVRDMQVEATFEIREAASKTLERHPS